MDNRAHRPGRMGSRTQGVVGASCQANGGPSSSENRAHQPGGDGESSPRGVRSLLPGLRGATFFRKPGAPAWGGRGVQPRGCSEPPARPMGGQYLRRTGRTSLGGTGSPAQGVFGASCQAYVGSSSSENRAHQPGGDGESCPGGVRGLLLGQWGAIFFRQPGAPARGGQGVLPSGCSEPPARPMAGHLPQRTGRTGLGGAGSPAQGVFGASCQAYGGPSSSENRAHRPAGDGESSPGGVQSLLPGPMGGQYLRRTRRTGLGGTGSPAQGVFGASCQANGGPISSENRAHQPGGDGESSPGGVRSLLPGLRGVIFLREPGAPARGGRGVLPRGCSGSPARPMGGHLLQTTGRTGPGGTGSPAQRVFGASCQANGGPSSSENRAHRPGGGGESSPRGVRSLLPGLRGAIFFREPGAPACGGRGVQPRGCSEPPARANGGPISSENQAHRPGEDGESSPGGVRSLLPGQWGPSSSENRAHRPGGDGESCPGGVRSLLQGQWGASSSENRAHQPGGDGESCPGGVRSLLSGQWGAIFFREPGAPARGGRGVLPRGCSESPARPVGGHLLQRTGRTGPGGMGSPAQGVFGVSCQGQWWAIFFRETGAPAWQGRGVLPRGCSESPARPVGGHLLQRTGRTGPGGTGSPAQGVFGVSCQGQRGAIFFREPGAPARGGRGVLPRGCSASPARANGGTSSSENRAHRPGGDGESCPGGVRSLLQGQWGAIFFREPGAPARGGRGVLPRGCSESPARPMGGHLLRRTWRTGPGGTGSPAQGVFGASGRTRGYSLLPLSSSRQVCRQYWGS